MSFKLLQNFTRGRYLTGNDERNRSQYGHEPIGGSRNAIHLAPSFEDHGYSFSRNSQLNNKLGTVDTTELDYSVAAFDYKSFLDSLRSLNQ